MLALTSFNAQKRKRWTVVAILYMRK